MSDTYTKLFSSITESTVWGEPYATRIVWVAMLAMADARGNVYGAVPGLARRANVTLEEVEAALKSFMAPDPYSRTKDEDGRRIEEIEGGWRLINHAKYGAIRSTDERREYKRDWDRSHRAKGSKPPAESDTHSDNSDTNPTNPTEPTPPALTPALKEQKKSAPSGADLFPGIDPKVVADFRALRKAKKAAITETAVEGIKREADKAGWGLEQALRTCCERGWIGFKAEWVAGQRGDGGSAPPPERKRQLL